MTDGRMAGFDLMEFFWRRDTRQDLWHSLRELLFFTVRREIHRSRTIDGRPTSFLADSRAGVRETPDQRSKPSSLVVCASSPSAPETVDFQAFSNEAKCFRLVGQKRARPESLKR
jgi:hypothetical protein